MSETGQAGRGGDVGALSVASRAGDVGKHEVEQRPLRVLYLSVEVEPYAKTGGLGDVSRALPKALRGQGVDVRVCLPRYGHIPEAVLAPEPVLTGLDVPVDGRIEPVVIRAARAGSLQSRAAAPVPVYLVESKKYFGRESIYGYSDDGERFIVYCRAALELCRALDWAPDIVHCHDWHTGIVPNWLQTIYRDDRFFSGTASVFTIHNLAYQGVFDSHLLEVAGIEAYGFVYPQIADFGTAVNFMGRGILFADAVTTVSERYAEEILTPEYGEKLDPLLRDRQDRLFGILNGIDQEELDPRTDPHLSVNFGSEDLELRLQNKLALQREAGLPVEAQTPIVGMIGRLTGQKGLDLLAPVAQALLRQPLQLVILGTGDASYHDMLRHVQAAHPDRAAMFLTFNTPLAQRIYGGADLFLMPSRYEPCGLGQMIAMRYGSVPAVRATGGLATTVQDWDPRAGAGNGFSFQRYDPMELFATVIRAVETYKYGPVWRDIQKKGMETDFSWERSAGKYRQVYHFALRSKEQGAG